MNNIKKDLENLNLKIDPIFNQNEHEKYTNDWRGQYIGNAFAVLKPSNIFEVSNILKYANTNKIPIVPQGGNTGLCGGATPIKNSNSLIVSTEKLNKIISLEKNSNSITLESGVILSDIHKKVEELNLFFPLNLGAKGSCMIGGNLSTNAGGINVLKYGTTRDLCLGLEVVLPNGEILKLLNNLKKDNTGYDLKNLFIGAEGTLGIITAATFKLFPLPKAILTTFVESNTISNAVNLLNIFQKELPYSIEAFELMPRVFWEVASNNIDNISLPFNKIPEMGLLIDISTSSINDTIADSTGSNPLNEKLEKILSIAHEKGLISDAIICKNESERNQLWHIRESAAESEKKELEKSSAIKCLKHDISLPIKNIEKFHIEAQKMIKSSFTGTRTIYFGHLGDGNLHYNIFGNDKLPDGFGGKSLEITDKLYEIVKSFDGSFSAEHGIGQLRKKSLILHKDPVAYSLMKMIKKQFDPNNIMNPEKIFV